MSEYEAFNAGASQAQTQTALSRLFAQTAGLLASPGVLGGLVVSQATTANGTVLIAGGSCVLHPTMATFALLVNDTTKTLDVFTTNPVGALPRNDIVVFDSITFSITVIVGVPNTVPSDPSVPTTALRLARLRHAAAAATIPASKIDTLLVATGLRGTPVPVANAAAQSALPLSDGLQCYRLDTNTVLTCDGTGWAVPPGSNMGTPTANGSAGPYTVSVGEYFDTTLGIYTFTALAGRRYEARLNGMLAGATVPGDQFVVRIRNGGPRMPLNTSPQVAVTQADISSVAGNEAPGAPISGTFVPGAGTVTLAVSLQRSVGSGAASCAGTRELYAVDLGPA